jgi:hypothetical protein
MVSSRSNLGRIGPDRHHLESQYDLEPRLCLSRHRLESLRSSSGMQPLPIHVHENSITRSAVPFI